MFDLIDRVAAWWLAWRTERAARAIEIEDKVELRRAEYLPNEWRVDLIAPNLLFLIDEATALLNAQHAENYIQFEMLPRADRTHGRPVRVTIQWVNGESPAQQNARLRAELTELRAKNEAIDAS